MARRLWTEQRRVAFLPCVPSILRALLVCLAQPRLSRLGKALPSLLLRRHALGPTHDARAEARRLLLRRPQPDRRELAPSQRVRHHEPQSVLVTGSSAGGIGALLHADYFSRHFDNAIVKASPACGFFYAGVSSLRDWESKPRRSSISASFPNGIRTSTGLL